jgi:hypothetical protein
MGPIRSASRAETLPPAIRPVCSVLVIWHAGSGPRLELGTAYLAVPRLRMFCSKAVETGKTTAEPPLTRGLTHRGGGRCESAEPDPHHVSGLGAKVPSRQKSALLSNPLLQMQTYRASGQVAEETRPPQNPLFHVFIQIGLLCRFNVNIVYFWCCTAAPVDLFQKV